MRSTDNHKSTKRRAYNNPVVRLVILGLLSVCGHCHIFSSPVGVTHKESLRTFVSSPLFLCLSVIYSVYLCKHLSDCLLVQCMEVHHAELQEERVSAGLSPQSA